MPIVRNGETEALFASDVLRVQAKLTPDALACEELVSAERLTYAEIDALVDHAASWMRAITSKGARIALLGRNSIDTVILFHAAMRSGRILQLVSWRLTAGEIAAILEDATPELLIFDREFSTLICDIPAMGSLCRDQEDQPLRARWRRQMLPRQQVCGNDTDAAGPDTTVLLLYTSGTTGRAKGVELTRTNILAGAANFTAAFDVMPGSRLRCDMPMFHIAALGVANAAFLAGATMLITDRFDAQAAARHLADSSMGITHYFAVPQLAAALLDAARRHPGGYSGLHCLPIGGGALDRQIVEGFAALGIIVTNTYGITEATGTVTAMPTRRDTVLNHPASCGTAAPFIDIRIVGNDGRDCSPGVAGEIWLRGPAVSPGYWQDERRCRDEWFPTGDIARCDKNGIHEILDRRKDMYISGGENVYPTEIEIALRQHPGVKDVAVIGIADPKWGETGCAFIVPNAPALTADDILEWCTARIARFKIPSKVYFLDELPRNQSGKVRKDKLRTRFDW